MESGRAGPFRCGSPSKAATSARPVLSWSMHGQVRCWLIPNPCGRLPESPGGSLNVPHFKQDFHYSCIPALSLTQTPCLKPLASIKRETALLPGRHPPIEYHLVPASCPRSPTRVCLPSLHHRLPPLYQRCPRPDAHRRRRSPVSNWLPGSPTSSRRPGWRWTSRAGSGSSKTTRTSGRQITRGRPPTAFACSPISTRRQGPEGDDRRRGLQDAMGIALGKEATVYLATRSEIYLLHNRTATAERQANARSGWRPKAIIRTTGCPVCLRPLGRSVSSAWARTWARRTS